MLTVIYRCVRSGSKLVAVHLWLVNVFAVNLESQGSQLGQEGY